MEDMSNKAKKENNWMWFRSWFGVSGFRLDWQRTYA